MNLAKALKQKNRMAQKISGIQQEIQNENVIRVDEDGKIDVEKLMADFDLATNNLIKLKIAIFVASTPMRENILRLGELKSRIVFLRGINTREGKMALDYSDVEVEYKATFDKVYIKAEVEKCEEKIDLIQDELDTFNHKTEVIIK